MQRDFKKNILKTTKGLLKSVEDEVESMQKLYSSDLVKAKEDLLVLLCNDLNLDYDSLHKKYIVPYKKTLSKNKKNVDIIECDSDDDIQNEENIFNNEQLLEKKQINNKTYFVDEKEGGPIYNQEADKVGEVKNGQYVIY